MRNKAFFDASVRPDQRRCFISGVIKRDNENILAYSVEMIYIKSIERAEYYALIEILKRINRLKLRDIEIIGDNKPVIDRVNGDCRVRGRLGRRNKLNEQARMLLLSIPSSKLTWAKRKHNKEADRLSKGVVVL